MTTPAATNDDSKCKRCGAERAERVPKYLDEDRSWVGGYDRFACGVQVLHSDGWTTPQPDKCRIRELEAELARRDERIAELEAALASHDTQRATAERNLLFYGDHTADCRSREPCGIDECKLCSCGWDGIGVDGQAKDASTENV